MAGDSSARPIRSQFWLRASRRAPASSWIESRARWKAGCAQRACRSDVTGRRRFLVGVTVAALLLVGGRAVSALYADYTWYSAMGATPLWNERAGDVLLIYGIGCVLAVVLTFVNLSALARSIGAL